MKIHRLTKPDIFSAYLAGKIKGRLRRIKCIESGIFETVLEDADGILWGGAMLSPSGSEPARSENKTGRPEGRPNPP